MNARQPNRPSALPPMNGTQHLRRSVRDLLDAIGETADDIDLQLRARMHAQPYLTMAVAAGAGYLVARAVPGRLAASLIGLGGRLAGAVLVRELAMRLAPFAPPEAEEAPA